MCVLCLSLRFNGCKDTHFFHFQQIFAGQISLNLQLAGPFGARPQKARKPRLAVMDFKSATFGLQKCHFRSSKVPLLKGKSPTVGLQKSHSRLRSWGVGEHC